jgi:hypothetical protein
MRKEFEMDPEADTLLQRVEFVELDEIFLRDVELPDSLQKSMVEKNQQQQMMLEYDYRIEREEKEKKRKKIEAEGIRQFQDIVKDGITDRYLMWKGIDATLQLSQSPNAKVIVIGAGKTGLPILLGNLDAVIAPPAAADASSSDGKALTPLTNTPELSNQARSESPPNLPGLPPLPGTGGDSGKGSSQLPLPPATNAPAPENGAPKPSASPQKPPR